MAYLSKLFALERGGGDYKLDKSNLIAPVVDGANGCSAPEGERELAQSAKIFALIIEIHSVALFTTKQPVAVFGNVRGFPSNQRIPS
jgi:hypothetical protein